MCDLTDLDLDTLELSTFAVVEIVVLYCIMTNTLTQATPFSTDASDFYDF